MFPLVIVAAFGLGYASRSIQGTSSGTQESFSKTRQGSNVGKSSRERDETPAFQRPVLARVVKRKLPSEPFEPGQSREWMLSQIKKGGWKDDPSALFRMLQEYSAMDESEISEVVETLLQIIRERQAGDPAHAAAFPKEWLFKYGIFPAIFRFSQLNPNATLDLIERDPLLKDSDAYQVAFSNLALQDPDQALARTKGLEGNALRNAMEPILGTLFSTDPERVIRILDGLPHAEFDGERRKVAERLASEDPERAINYAVAAVKSGQNADILQGAVGIWMQSDPTAARQWVDSYKGPGSHELKTVQER